MRRRERSAPFGKKIVVAEPYTEDTWIAYDQNAEEIELEVIEDG